MIGALILSSIAVLLLISAFIIALRNNWVFNYRINIINEDSSLKKYHKLPSYDSMMMHFWKCNYDEYINSPD
jgi:hypothetical protein